MQTVNFNYQELKLSVDSAVTFLQKVIPRLNCLRYYSYDDCFVVFNGSKVLLSIDFEDILPLLDSPVTTELIYDLFYQKILDALGFKLWSKVSKYCYGVNDPDLFCKQFQDFVLDAGLPITVRGVSTGYTWTILLSLGSHHKTYTLELGNSMSIRPSSASAKILINWILDELACDFEEERP